MNLPTIIFLKYFQWSWMKSIFGPYLINVNIWIAGWLTIGTVSEIYIAFPHFNPMIGIIVIIISFISFRVKKIGPDNQKLVYKNQKCWVCSL